MELTLNDIQEYLGQTGRKLSDICIETTPMYCVYKQIIQKISEVENEHNG